MLPARGPGGELPGTTRQDVARRTLAFVIFERGDIEQRVVHDETRVESRRVQRAREVLAHKYAEHAPDDRQPDHLRPVHRRHASTRPVNAPPPNTHGAHLNAAAPQDRPAIHAARDGREAFADYDRVVTRLLDDAIRGKQILNLTEATRRTENDQLTLKIGDDERAALAAVLDRAAQQAQGAWYLPDTDRPLAGVIQFACWAQKEPRFSIGAADAQRGAVALDSPDTILVWALLEPVITELFLPFKLRSGYWLGDRRPDQMTADWARAERAYRTLGIDTDPVDSLKDGRRWARLGIDDVLDARRRILQAWTDAPADVGQRALVLAISNLVERYYSKAKDGKAQRSKVLNKTLERVFTGTFGGDWIALVSYLGEDIHPAEQIATAVTPTSLMVSGADRARQAAAASGAPVEEIQRMLAASSGGHDHSPVEQRANVTRDWWQAFDELHARQAPGMPSLWGLLGDRTEDANRRASDEDDRYTPRGYLMLPSDLVASVEMLWGTTVLDRWPTASSPSRFRTPRSRKHSG